MTSRTLTAAVLFAAVAAACAACASGQKASTGSTSRSAALPSSTAAPPSPPAFEGLYLQFVDAPHATYNGVPRPAGAPMTQWWAFKSTCMPTGCVATSTKLNDFNTSIAEMPPNQRVYRFVDGAWEWLHDDAVNCQTAAGGGAPGSTQAHFVTRLTPQSDGTLTGESTSTALDGGCNDKGAVVKTPTSYVRKADVPPNVPMIDPTTAR